MVVLRKCLLPLCIVYPERDASPTHPSIPPPSKALAALFGSLLQSQHELRGVLPGVLYQILKALHLR